MTYTNTKIQVADLLRNRPSSPHFFQYAAHKPNSMFINPHMVGTFDGQPLCCGDVVDTEYQNPSWQELRTKTAPPGREGVTLQVNGIYAGELRRYAHPDFIKHADNHNLPHLFAPCFHNDAHVGGFIVFDYWREEGFHVEVRRATPTECQPPKKGGLPALKVLIASHFGLAELYMMFRGAMLADIDARVHAREIVMQRRLIARQKRQDNPWSKPQRDTPPFDHVKLPYAVTLNSACTYRLELGFIDSCAVHGPVSFGTLCDNVNLGLRVKDEVKDKGLIIRMRETTRTHYQTFLDYTEDDGGVYEALLRHRTNTADLYAKMGVGAWYDGHPPLTVGKASQKLFQAILEKHCGVDPGKHGAHEREALLALKRWATADYLSSFVNDTTALLGKVEGGRCRNNRPTVSWLNGPIADIDISSCYGRGLTLQLYPLGQPLILGLPIDSPGNEYPTLQTFLRQYGADLVPGLWHARVSLDTDYVLLHPQDFLGSWFDYKIRDMREQVVSSFVDDSYDTEENMLDVRSGSLKILRHDIQDAVITDDFINWLQVACSPAQREELLTHLRVKCALYYPKCAQVDSLQTLAHGREHHRGTNHFRVKRVKGQLHRITDLAEYHGWFAFNIGELLVNQLLAMRNSYEKGTPMNALLKLCTNALFGDSVSPHFDTSDMCVGNNITARARAMAWYLEKGLHTVQTITDGGQFELNGTIMPGNRRLTAENMMDVSRDTSHFDKGRLRRLPLGNYDRITLEWDTDQDGKPLPILHLHTHKHCDTKKGTHALHWIDDKALAQLRDVWQGARVLQDFTFETKMVYDRGSFHGSGNYYLQWPGKPIIKMRSYERKQHYALDYADDGMVDSTFYATDTPAATFLFSLFSPHDLQRQMVFAKNLMLKDGDYRARYAKVFQYSNLHPCCDIWKVGLLREFSLSQYTFATIAQYKAIKRQWEVHKHKYGQFIEALFHTDTGRLNYAAMILAADEAITSGSHTLMETIAPNYGHHDHVRMHPAFATLARAKADVALMQGLAPDDAHDTVSVNDTHAEHAWDHKPRDYFYDTADAAD